MRIVVCDLLTRLHREEKGASLVEYALALLVVAVVSTATFSVMGTQVATNSTVACTAFTNGVGNNAAGAC